MFEAYSLNETVAADTAIPFNNTTIEKGCTVTKTSPSSINLNRRGVYRVTFDASAEAEGTVELFKDGVAQPQAQSTGTTLGFSTLVQCDRDNCGCCCSSPVILQLKNVGEAEVTFANCNVTVTKEC